MRPSPRRLGTTVMPGPPATVTSGSSVNSTALTGRRNRFQAMTMPKAAITAMRRAPGRPPSRYRPQGICRSPGRRTRRDEKYLEDLHARRLPRHAQRHRDHRGHGTDHRAGAVRLVQHRRQLGPVRQHQIVESGRGERRQRIQIRPDPGACQHRRDRRQLAARQP